MSLPAQSIHRPVTVLMVTLITLLFGLVSLTKLPVELYPNTSFGQISIILYVRGGMPPSDVEFQVTRPVEEAVATVSNLEDMVSISKEGEATVVLSFRPGTDMDFAALEVREKFAKVKNSLPKEIEKPVIAQFEQGDVPVVVISATSDKRTPEEIRKLVGTTLQDSLKRITGVANVEIVGGRERKILVDVDQVRLASYGMAIEEVTQVLSSNNLNLLSGEVQRPTDRYLVRVMGEFEDIEQIRHMPLRRAVTGNAIRLRDVATVTDGYLEPNQYSRLNIQPVVTLYVQKESTKNTITVAKTVVEELERLKPKFPRDINLVVTSNQAEFIKKAIDNLQESLLQGIVLIILVFFLFLFRLSKRFLIVITALILLSMFAKGWLLSSLFVSLVAAISFVKKYRSIIVVTLPIPISVIGTFVFMKSYGLTVNVMTLFGLALGVGMLVDNSIVVFENILKKREEGVEVRPASIEGSQEMFLSLVASTLTNVIVFLPMVFMGQDLQRLYAGMSWTIVISILISMICAVTLVPMMCSRPGFAVYSGSNAQDAKDSWVNRFSNFERRFLFRSIRHRGKVLVVCVLLFCVAFYFASRLGLEYLGSTEQNKFTIFIELPTGARIDVVNKTAKRVENFVNKLPEVKNVSSRIENWTAKVYVELVGSRQRKKSVDEVIESIRPETNKVKPGFVHFQQEEQVGTKEVIVEIFGYNYDKLRELAIAIANRMDSVKGLSDTKIRMREGRPEMQVLIQKSLAGHHGLTVEDSANQVHGQMRGHRATVYHVEGQEVETISRLDEKYRKTFKDLHNLIMNSKTGDPVLLDQISEFKFGLGPSEIWRKDKNRFIQVSSNIGKVPLSKMVDTLKEKLKSIPFPENYFYRFGGDYPVLMKSNKDMKFMIAIVLILVYLVLASLFESFTQPVLIMVAVPLALIGAVIALYVGPKSIGIGAMLGMMMLAGIVVNNSIMLVDRINYYVRERHTSDVKAAVFANRDRLRPVLMTMSGTVLGLIPMAIDKSEGANLWSPLAMTVIGGVVSSTILTLMVTPAFYILFNDANRFFKSGYWFKLAEKIVKFISAQTRRTQENS